MTISQVAEQDTEQDYQQYMLALKDYVSTNIEGRKLFTTNATGLFEIYLANLPFDKQHYNCHACRKFIETYGGLVYITDGGRLLPFLWSGITAPEYFCKSVVALAHIVIQSKVTGVFFDNKEVWGTPVTGEWSHLHIVPPLEHVYRSLVKNAYQASAEKKEDFKNVVRALSEYPLDAINQAVAVLKQDQLYRSEKVLGIAEWLQKLHNDVNNNKGFRSNIIWLAVAKAPAGFCHPRSSMIGTLLDDIVAGLPFEIIVNRFADKMNPTQYQRPQTLPSAGNIKEAERIVEKMGIAKSLERRFARLEELQTVWTPSAIEIKQTSGVFGHLEAKDKTKIKELDAPPQKITWDKFNRDVLPSADSIECLIPRWGSFTAFLTAADIDAPPILQWDSENQRNPFSTYVYTRGSSADTWGLEQLTYCAVTALCFQPSMWYDRKNTHHGKGITLILSGAKDNGYLDKGNAIFPENLKSELHGIRSTIEAYSNGAVIHGADEATANGIAIQQGSDVVIKVYANGIASKYMIDRWE